MSATFSFATLAFAIFSLCNISPVLAGPPPRVHYPLQAQLPPVARVNQTFIWTLLPDTFTSRSAMSYSAQDMPSWLSFNANSLTFTGVPSINDLGTTTVSVQANASDSSVGTASSFNCLVVDNAAPVVEAPVAAQLSDGRAVFSSSYLQADGTIRIPPKWSFSIGFQWYTFTDPEESPIYYTAYRADTTSLPNWIVFDNTTVTFDGLAPANENSFDIVLHGSDQYGYSDVTQTFTIVIGSHSFIMQEPLPGINVTAKEAITYDIPLSGLTLDGNPVDIANLSTVSVNLGNNSYLTYDNATLAISGTFPSDIPSTSDIHIPVTFVDFFNDTIISNITLRVIPQLFSESSIPSYNVTGGQSFTDSLASYLISQGSSYTATFNPATASDWLKFDNSSKELSGTPPVSGGQDVFVNITGQDAQTGVTESAGLHLLYTEAQARLQPAKHGGLSNGAKIALAVIFGILGGLLLLGIILWFCRRYCGKDEHRDVDDDATLAASAHEKQYGLATPMSTARLSQSSRAESDRLDRAIEAAEYSMAHAQATSAEPDRPRRMDLLNFFGGRRNQSQQSDMMQNGGSGRSLKEMLGLSPAKRAAYRQQQERHLQQQQQYADPADYTDEANEQPRRHEIIVVTDGDGYTYRPGSEMGVAHGTGENESQGHGGIGNTSERTRSSFDSHQSSSLFYSEETVESGSGNGDHSGELESPVQRPRNALTVDTPRSVPRQRRDFLPYQPPPNRGVTPSPSRLPSGGIRLVQPVRYSGSGLSITDSDEAYHAESSHQADLAADAAIATAHLEQLNSRDSLYTDEQSQHQLQHRNSARPRLIPFTSERRGERSDSIPERSFPSQKGIHAGSPSPDVSVEGSHEGNSSIDHDDSTEDAEEDGSPRRYSTIYHPPPGEETTAPIIFPSPAVLREPRTSPSPLRQEISPSPTKSLGSAKSSRSRLAVNSMLLEPLRIQLGAREPFHFTAQIHPPPPASIAPAGRDGPVRSSYAAFTDYPSEPDFDGLPLPDWLHFDPRGIEFWGTPEASDAGSIAVRVVERKHFPNPASPTRQRKSTDSRWDGTDSDEVEQIVGRFVLDVTDRRATIGSLGEAVAITY